MLNRGSANNERPYSFVEEAKLNSAHIQAMQAKSTHDMAQGAHSLLQSLRVENPSSILYTPMLQSSWLSGSNGLVYIKLESEQVTNSFKARGALNCVSRALRNEKPCIVTASTGNHATAVAHALKIHDTSGTIFVPNNIQSGKLKTLEDFIADAKVELKVDGQDCLEAELKGRDFAGKNSAVFVSPYNDRHVIAGQGTIGLEILEFLDKQTHSRIKSDGIKCCYVTVGGGGLISGIAACLKYRQRGTWRVVGCLPFNSPAMYKSVKAGRVVSGPCTDTLSDGSAGDLEEGSVTFDLCSNLVDAWAIINEVDIERAIRDTFSNHHKVVEGAAATAIAGCELDAEWRKKNNCSLAVVIACGGNIDPYLLAEILAKRPS